MPLAPLTSRICQRTFSSRWLEEFASETVVVCKSEREPLRPAFFLPGELDRICGVHEFSAGMRDEIGLVTSDVADHGETIAYRLRDAVLADRCICNFWTYRSLTFRRRPIRFERLREAPDGAALCSTAAGNDYFAHFLMDDINTALMGRQFGRVVFANVGVPRTTHIKEYLAKLEIAHEDMSRAYFKNLWFFRDFPQNSHRRGRLRVIRDTLRGSWSLENGESKPAYIRRGASGSERRLENESEIEELLAARGFVIVDPEKDSLADVTHKLRDSKLVVGVEGSHLVHALFHLSDNGTLICIQPAARFNAVYRGFTHMAGLNWGFVVAEGSATCFRLSVDRLLATIDMAWGGAG